MEDTTPEHGSHGLSKNLSARVSHKFNAFFASRRIPCGLMPLFFADGSLFVTESQSHVFYAPTPAEPQARLVLRVTVVVFYQW